MDPPAPPLSGRYQATTPHCAFLGPHAQHYLRLQPDPGLAHLHSAADDAVVAELNLPLPPTAAIPQGCWGRGVWGGRDHRYRCVSTVQRKFLQVREKSQQTKKTEKLPARNLSTHLHLGCQDYNWENSPRFRGLFGILGDYSGVGVLAGRSVYISISHNYILSFFVSTCYHQNFPMSLPHIPQCETHVPTKCNPLSHFCSMGVVGGHVPNPNDILFCK